MLKNLYQTVVIPEAVYNELTSNIDYQNEREEIEQCTFLVVEKVYNKDCKRIEKCNRIGLR